MKLMGVSPLPEPRPTQTGTPAELRREERLSPVRDVES